MNRLRPWTAATVPRRRLLGILLRGLVCTCLFAGPLHAEIEQDADGNLVEYAHAVMSDGVRIALAIGYPQGFDLKSKRKWPAIFQMSGYGSETRAAPHRYFGGYVTVNASLRGTGASGGKFSLFSERSTQDGHEIIEDWIVKQPWCSGKVGIHGHSWPGLTGFRVAATNPPHLRAVVVSGLFDDARRGLSQIGGIRNIGFPVNWTSNFQRADGVFGSDSAAVESRRLSAAEAKALRVAREKVGRPQNPTRSERRSELATLRELAPRIRAPIFLGHAYQDQQTGPSGAWLFAALSPDTPKWLLLSNGHHGMPVQFIAERRAWFDYWLRGKRHDALAGIESNRSLVQAFFEVQNMNAARNAPLVSSGFPLPETRWIRYYMAAAGELAISPPGEDATVEDTYEVTQGAAGGEVDRVVYRRGFEQPTAICGPIVVTLWARCTAADTDFFVLLSDVAPDGRIRHLQRGMLRASCRTLDEQRSTRVRVNGLQVMVRPHHDLDRPRPLAPGKVTRFEIEVFPVGHVFRKGHQLALSIGATPLDDPVPYPKGKRDRIQRGSYKYESQPPASTVSIQRSAAHPSSVLLPLLPTLPPVAEALPATLDRFWTDSGK